MIERMEKRGSIDDSDINISILFYLVLNYSERIRSVHINTYI